jgi:hypothetical protein
MRVYTARGDHFYIKRYFVKTSKKKKSVPESMSVTTCCVQIQILFGNRRMLLNTLYNITSRDQNMTLPKKSSSQHTVHINFGPSGARKTIYVGRDICR